MRIRWRAQQGTATGRRAKNLQDSKTVLPAWTAACRKGQPFAANYQLMLAAISREKESKRRTGREGQMLYIC